MKRNYILVIVIVAIAIQGALLSAQSTTAFTYQGELTQNGSPANGSFNIEFELWSASAGGVELDFMAINGVQVVDGRFSVELDFDPEFFDNNGRWLQIKVAGTTLQPRQEITRAPYAIQTRGLFVDQSEQVGIGTTSPSAPLHVQEGSVGVSASGSSSAVFERFGSNYVTLLSPNGNERGILFGDPESSVNGGIIYNNPVNPDGLLFRTAGNLNQMAIDDVGNVGIGTTNPGAKLSVSQDSPGDEAILAFSNNDQPTIAAANFGFGYALTASSPDDASLAGGGIVRIGLEPSLNIAIDNNEIMARNNGAAASLFLNAEGGDVFIGSTAGTSKLVTPILQITGGSDLSELFDIGGGEVPQPGMVVVIDSNNPGKLIVADSAFDKRVAGIISGAGGVSTGMTMGQDGTIADGKYPVALSGRVYCLVDATDEAVVPGDMLTTSTKRGHAMKVTNVGAAGGAIIGKAMTTLEKGQTGLVLVLVNLQ